MKTNILKNRVFITITFSIIIFLLLSFRYISVLGELSHSINIKINTYFYGFKNDTYLNTSTKEVISNDIVVVEIGEEAYNTLGFPIPRGEYRTVIENINSGGAEVIGFDIIFADNNVLDKEGDDNFANAIKEAGNIVLGGAIIAKDNDGTIYPVIEEPLEKFYTGALGFGYFKPTIDPITDIALKFKPVADIYDKNFEKNTYNHFSVSLLKSYFGKVYNQDYTSYNDSDTEFYYYRPNSGGIPYYESGKENILINYIPLPSNSTNKSSLFTNVSFMDVYSGKVNPSIFEGKIVIVGVTAKGVKDVFYTPNGIEYGVYILANIVNTVLTKNYLIFIDENLELLLIFLLIILSFYLNLSRSGYVLIFSNIAIGSIFLIIYPISILIYTNYLLNYTFELYFALIFSLTFSNTYKYLTENKNRKKLNKALSEYVSKAVADEVLSNSGKVKLDGEKKRLAIYFSDIEGFTTISEDFKPEDLVGFLREYLSDMSDVIMDDKGFINKYEGDAIMALWGSFIDYDRGAYYSCLSAIKQQQLLKKLNKDWIERGFREIKVRIGLHVGEAIVGNIGSAGRKMEYTALGDNVNLASRLEGVNKFYGTYICVSEDIYNEVKNDFEFRYLDIIRVKGKSKPVSIYELLCLKGEITKEQEEIRNIFNKGVELYINKEFRKAKTLFNKLIKLGDNASKTYLDMCELYIMNPPLSDWDGVSTMTSK